METVKKFLVVNISGILYFKLYLFLLIFIYFSREKWVKSHVLRSGNIGNFSKNGTSFLLYHSSFSPKNKDVRVVQFSSSPKEFRYEVEKGCAAGIFSEDECWLAMTSESGATTVLNLARPFDSHSFQGPSPIELIHQTSFKNNDLFWFKDNRGLLNIFRNGEMLYELRNKFNILACCFTPSQENFFIIEGQSVTVWGIPQKGNPGIIHFNGLPFNSGVLNVVFSKNERFCFINCKDNSCILLDWKNFKTISNFQGLATWGEKNLFSCLSREGNCYVGKIMNNGKVVDVLTLSNIAYFHFSHDAQKVACINRIGKVEVYETIENGRSFLFQEGHFEKAIFLNNKERLALKTDSEIMILNLNNFEIIDKFPSAGDYFFFFKNKNSENYLITAGNFEINLYVQKGSYFSFVLGVWMFLIFNCFLIFNFLKKNRNRLTAYRFV